MSVYNCEKCGLPYSDGATGTVLPQCNCRWQQAARGVVVGGYLGWDHYCEAERAYVTTWGPCNWCGKENTNES